MKKILVFILCLMFLVVTPVVGFAMEDGADGAEKTTTEVVVSYVQENFGDISVVFTLLGVVFYEVRKHIKLNNSIGTLNNNAITVSQNSEETIKKALEGVADVVITLNKYKGEFESLLGEVRKSAEEKQALEDTLAHVENFLKTSKLATVELSNEVAELLVLANIPPSKKEELYSRHRAAVDAISVAESEVTANDGEEA